MGPENTLPTVRSAGQIPFNRTATIVPPPFPAKQGLKLGEPLSAGSSHRGSLNLDTSTGGKLYYDADASDAEASVLIAHVKGLQFGDQAFGSDASEISLV